MGRALYQTWLRTVQSRPNQTAVREADGSSVSFAGIQEAVEANLLRFPDLEGCRNRILAIQFENSSRWLEAFLAGRAAGAIILPFDPDVPPDGLNHILHQVKPAALWNDSGLQRLPGSRRKGPACLVKLTSGSTGAPRPLVFSDEEMLADGEQVCRTMGIHGEDLNLALVPFGHSYGLGNLVMPLIQFGTPVAVCSDPFPHSIAGLIARTRATVVPAVPALLNGLARAGIDPETVASVRLWISAGSPLQAADAALFHERIGTPIHNFYGSSETGGIAFDRTGRETLSGRSVGQPLEGVEASISGSGRLHIRSRAVYRRDNPHRRGRIGEHLLADLARILDDGSISLQGRRSRMVKMSGKRVNLGEIEKQLLRIDGLEAAHVRDYRDAGGRTRLAAAYSPEMPVELVREALRRFLPPWKIPSKWLGLEKFPLNARGKVNTRRLETLIGQALDPRER